MSGAHETKIQNPKVQYAGFWIRAIALLIDFTLLNVVGLIPQFILAQVFGLSPFYEQVVGELISLVILVWYYCFFLVRTGSTLGKRLFSIEVVSESTGLTLTRKQAVIRMFSYIPSLAILGCGFLMAAFHPQKKTLHDVFAGTVCIRKKKV